MTDILPFVTLDQAQWLYNFGEWLVYDDRDDIGRTTYKNRKGHYYHGKHSPNHDSPFHHWQIGGLLLLAAQMLGTLAVAREVQLEEKDNSNLQ